MEVINPYLKKVFMNNELRVTCITWRKLFKIQELVYKEMCLEFMPLFSFRVVMIPLIHTSLLSIWEEHIGSVVLLCLHGGWVSTVGQRP